MPPPVNSGDDMNNGVTYFVDNEGRYYYHSTGGNQTIIELPASSVTAATSENDSIVGDKQGIVGVKDYPTVTLVPADNGDGELSYVLVVQKENKPGVGNNEKNDNHEDDYIIDEEHRGGVEEAATEEDVESAIPKLRKEAKRAKNTAPPLSCTFCNYTTQKKYLLNRHLKTHLLERPHVCNVCDRDFKTLGFLQSHLKMHYNLKSHVCKHCEKSFNTSGELTRHIRYKHMHEKPQQCTECEYSCVELCKLRSHMQCHTRKKHYQCPRCTNTFSETLQLKQNLRSHTGEKPYKCDICNMRFKQPNALTKHMLIHNIREKPVFACKLCPVKCGRLTELRNHVKNLHSSDKPVKCKRCGKSFPDRYSCKVHTKTHEGEKCFKCEVCPYAATTVRLLNIHMLKHTDEKPFVCDYCKHTFRQKQLLRRHINLHHNPNYKPPPPKEKPHCCFKCGQTFAQKGYLIRHLEIHDPNSGYRERMLALQLGRQKKVKIVKGQKQVFSEGKGQTRDSEVIELGMSVNDMQCGELVTVGDGQQYVVLDLIVLEDGTQQVQLVDPNCQEVVDEILEEEGDKQSVNNKVEMQATRSKNAQKEVETFFDQKGEDIEINMRDGTMECLPDELVSLVLSYLPPATLLRMSRRVSRRWRYLAARHALLVRTASDLDLLHAALKAVHVTTPLPELRSVLQDASRLRYLAVSAASPLRYEDVSVLSQLPQLDHIDVFLRDRVADVRFAASVSSVSTLVLNETASPGTLHSLSSSQRLTALHMYGRALYYPRSELRLLLRALGLHLRELTLRCTELADRDYEALAACTGLVILRLYSCWMLRSAGALAITSLLGLKELHITGARMLRATALHRALDALPAGLEEIALSAGWLRDDHLLTLSARCLRLKVLEAWRCRVTADGLVRAARALPFLEDLDTDLTMNARHLIDLAKHEALRRVRCVPEDNDLIWRDNLNGLLVSPAGLSPPAALLRGAGEGARASALYHWGTPCPAPPRHVPPDDPIQAMFEPDALYLDSWF